MLLRDLVEISRKVSLTSRKKEKVLLIASLLSQFRGEEVRLAASYLSGRIPQGRLGVGLRTMEEALRDLPRREGPLYFLEVDRFFDEIASQRGAGSLERKIRALREMLSRAREEEQRFLSSLIMGEMRQGALEGLVLEAIGKASGLPQERIRQAFMFSGDVGEVARAAIEEGEGGLGRFGPRLFRPIAPMLASPAEDEGEALKRLGEAGWEYKMDGARVQIHKGGDEVRVFTRHLKEVTKSVPEVVELGRHLPFREAILEGEALALRQDGRPQPFQVTMRRFGRVKEVEKMRREIPLTPYLFDLLYLDGESLIQVPYRERFRALSDGVPSENLISRIVTADKKEVEEFLRRSISAGHEGLMAKGLDSPYVAGHRGFHWLKIKRAQTLDLVILAAEWGHGRRKGYLSNLHLGAWDPKAGRFVMLGKTFKGLTDEMLRYQTKRLLELETGRDEWTVYVRPELVVEVAFSDLQESPRYPAGIALRFARVKGYRPDKSPQEADTIERVREIFEAQRR